MATKLVQSVDPRRDQIISKNGAEIVIFANSNEICLLTYYPPDNCWYITGHQSVQSATGKVVPEANFYWRGVGYLNEALSSYGLLTEDDPISAWNDIYSDLKGGTCEESIEDSEKIPATQSWFRMDKSGHIIKWNESFAALLGVDDSRIYGHVWTDFIHIEDAPAAHQLWSDFQKTKDQAVLSIEFRPICNDDVWVILQITTENSSKNDCYSYVGTALDVTPTKLRHLKMEAAFQKQTLEINASDARLEQMLSETSIGNELLKAVVKQSAECVNARFAFIARVQNENIVPLVAIFDSEFIEVPARTYVGSPCETVIRNHETVCYQGSLTKQFPGFSCWDKFTPESFFGTPVFNQHHQVVAVIGIYHDKVVCQNCTCKNCRSSSLIRLMSTRVGNELERQKSYLNLGLFNFISENSTDAIVTVDRFGLVSDWNKSAERLFGYSKDEMLGQPVTILTPEYLQKQTDGLLKKALKNGEAIRTATTRRMKSGTHIHVYLNAMPLIDINQEIVGCVALVRTIERTNLLPIVRKEVRKLKVLSHS